MDVNLFFIIRSAYYRYSNNHFPFFFSLREINGKAKHEPSVRKERPQKRGGGRFEPYGNPSKRYRVFVSNIPYDVKWQALKDLMKEKGMVLN